MRFASKHGNSVRPLPPADATNHSGRPAYSQSLHETVARLAFCGVLGDQFYRREEDVAQELVDVCRQMAEKDSLFLAKAALLSREADLKLFPRLALGSILAQREANPAADAFAARLLSTYNAGQLLEFVLILKARTFGAGLGARAQRIVARALMLWGRERQHRQAVAEGASLRRVLRLVHPPEGTFSPEAAQFLKGCDVSLLSDAPLLRGAVRFRTAVEARSWSEAQSLLREHRFGFNWVKGMLPPVESGPRELWREVALQMSPLQLLLNLAMVERNDLLSTGSLLEKIQSIGTSNRLMPMDFVRAISAASLGVVRSALRDSLLVRSIELGAHLEAEGLEGGSTAIVLDFSGSMGGERWETAVALSAPFLAMAPAARVWLFNDSPREFDARKMSDVRDRFNTLSNYRPQGSTDIAGALAGLPDGLRTVLLVTDEEENQGHRAAAVWQAYRQRNPLAHLVVVNCGNYSTKAFPDAVPGVTRVQTMTPNAYRMLTAGLRSGESLVEAIHEQPFDGN